MDQLWGADHSAGTILLSWILFWGLTPELGPDRFEDPLALRIPARIRWGTAALAMAVLSVVTGAVAVGAVREQARREQRPTPTLALLVGCVIALMILVLHLSLPDPLSRAITATLKDDFPAARTALAVAGTVPMAAGVFVVLAFWRLAGGAPGTRGSAMERLADLQDRSRWLDLILYLGAGVLVLSLLAVGAIYSWTAELAPAARDAVEGVGQTIVVGLGTTYSLVLAGAYLPASLAVDREAQALLDGNPDIAVSESEETEGAKVRTGIPPRHRSPLERLATLAAVLGPFLVGGPGQALLSLVPGFPTS